MSSTRAAGYRRSAAADRVAARLRQAMHTERLILPTLAARIAAHTGGTRPGAMLLSRWLSGATPLVRVADVADDGRLVVDAKPELAMLAAVLHVPYPELLAAAAGPLSGPSPTG